MLTNIQSFSVNIRAEMKREDPNFSLQIATDYSWCSMEHPEATCYKIVREEKDKLYKDKLYKDNSNGAVIILAKEEVPAHAAHELIRHGSSTY